MPIKKGEKLWKKRKRNAGGRPTKEKQKIKQTVADNVRAYIEANVDPVLGSYKKLTEVREINHYDKDGKLLFTDEVIDGATVRHWIDKFVPAAQQKIHITGNFKHHVRQEVIDKMLGRK